MQKIAVFVDDADHARALLTPLLARGVERDLPVHWIIVGCAPKLTHRIGKWVSNASREQWRERWGRALRARLEPAFATAGAATVEWMVARGPLDALCNRLRQRLGIQLRLLDARRPKLGVDTAPLPGTEPVEGARRLAKPIAVSSSLAVVLALTD